MTRHTKHNPLNMSILRNELQTLLKALDTELEQWIAEAEFLTDEDHLHTKIHERLKVVVALQTALLKSIEPNCEPNCIKPFGGESFFFEQMPLWYKHGQYGHLVATADRKVYHFFVGDDGRTDYQDVTEHYRFAYCENPPQG